MKTSI